MRIFLQLAFLVLSLTACLISRAVLADHLMNGPTSFPSSIRTPSGRFYADLLAAGEAKSKSKSKSKSDQKSGLSAEAIKEILTKGRKLNVPFYEQKGPKCGFYATSMVMAYWHEKAGTNAYPSADEGEPGDPGLKSLYSWALENGQLAKGSGETNPWHLTQLAQAYQYNSCDDFCLSGGSINRLRTSVMVSGVPAMVMVLGIDSDTGRPISKSYFGGHWVIVEGFYRYPHPDGPEYMIVKHGHSEGDKIWLVSDFERAWKLGVMVCIWPKL